MSYEGSEQILCKNGHYHWCDCYSFHEESWQCHICGAEAAWTNSVDETNGSDPKTGHGYGYIELEMATPIETCVCPECKIRHIIRAATYKIPKKKKDFGGAITW